MKVDIKSFLIGVLTTVNLFLLMGFDDHKRSAYDIENISDGESELIIWFDTYSGKPVANVDVEKGEFFIVNDSLENEEVEDLDMFKYLQNRTLNVKQEDKSKLPSMDQIKKQLESNEKSIEDVLN